MTTTTPSATSQMEALVAALQDPETRENALLELSKKRHVCRSRADAVVLLRCRTGAVTRDRRHFTRCSILPV